MAILVATTQYIVHMYRYVRMYCMHIYASQRTRSARTSVENCKLWSVVFTDILGRYSTCHVDRTFSWKFL